MSRGFLCPTTEEACENGGCVKDRCVERDTQEERAELDRKAYDNSVVINSLTLLDSDPNSPLEGIDRHGTPVYLDRQTGRWTPRAPRNSN